jgi:outer membrane protein TolC
MVQKSRYLSWTFLLYFVSIHSGLLAQEILTYGQFMDIVMDHHPLAYSSNLQKDFNEANLLMAKGGFDPKLGFNLDRKRFEDKTYYNVMSTGISIPTWYGIEVKSYYDRIGGDFVNASDKLPINGLFTMGVSFPLARGLVLDDRRFELKRATIFGESTQAIQQIMLNDLYFDATAAYLDWQQAFALREIANEGLQFAEVRFESTKSLYELGDKPSIDTLEIHILKTVRQQELLEADQNLINARFALNNFLWVDGLTPLEIEIQTIPEKIDQEMFVESINLLTLSNDWLDKHPDIRLSILKINELELENRLNKENLKPDIRLNYNPLINASSSYLPIGYNPNDFKLGASFYFPLFLRKERGKINFTKTKIYESQFNLSTKRLELFNKYETYINSTEYLGEQLTLISKNVDNYSVMLRSENRLFELGESSIFLVNSREVSFLQSKIKEMETKVKLIKNRLTALYISNQLAFRR